MSSSFSNSFNNSGVLVAAVKPPPGGQQHESSVKCVLPTALAEKVASGEVDLADWTKVFDYMKKLSRVEYKAILKSTRLPRTWAEKLHVFPAATSYFAYSKNRYRDVLADERTRVKLVGLEHDYINANYIDGAVLPGRPKVRYIACQAPLPTTFEDFWWMVWQEACPVIVMLTKFREKATVKAHPYWPKDMDEVVECGPISVALVTQKSLPGISISTLRVTNSAAPSSSSTRIVYHLFFTEWPDFGVPKSSRGIRNLLIYTNLYSDLGASQGISGPMIVHCSAGIGRTGAFLAIHAGLALIESNVCPDVAGIVMEMRRCRSGMIQTDAQYLFVYEALNDHLQQFYDFKKPQRVVSASSLLEMGASGNVGNSAKPFSRVRGRSVLVHRSKERDDDDDVAGSAADREPESKDASTEDLYKHLNNDNNNVNE